LYHLVIQENLVAMLVNISKISQLLITIVIATFSYTQLTVLDSPIGISQVLLLVAYFILFLNTSQSNKRYTVSVALIMPAIVLLSFISISIFFSFQALEAQIYNILALLLNVLLIIYFAIHKIKFNLFVNAGYFLLTTLFIIYFLDVIGVNVGIQVGYYPLEGYRLQGFSTNPNQLSMALLFFSIFFIEKSHSSRTKTSYIALIACVYFIYLTSSDAAMLGFLFGLLVYLYYTHLDKYLYLKLLFVLLSVLTLFILAPALVDFLNDKNIHQVSTRYKLWANGMQSFYNSPIVGNGLAAHSWLDNPLETHESHNLYIDILSNVGIAGFLIFSVHVLYIYIDLGKKTIVDMKPFIMALISSVLFYSLFHNSMRSIYLWLVFSIAIYFIRKRQCVD